MLNVYDISMTIREDMQVWKNYDHKKMSITNDSTLQTGTTNESRIHMNVHTGTHLDAPLHIVEGGAAIDTIPLERLVGPARVLDLTDASPSIGAEHLRPFAIQPGEWILLKTKDSFNETADFDREFVYLNGEGASYLAERQINGVAIDALGVERDQPGYPTHKALFAANILIVEGVRLKSVPPGNYTLVLAPLKLEGIDAAPARAFLFGRGIG